MAAHPCPKCGKLRKVDIIVSSDGWHQPPCYNCGDPGYIEPHEKESEMGETEDRKRDTRESDQDAYDRQQSELQAEREERNARLGIGNHTEDGPKPESPVGGNLPAELGTEEQQVRNFEQAQEDDEVADDTDGGGQASRVTPA